MRIISKRRDYYDGYMNYDKKDRHNKVWVRKTKEVEVHQDEINLFISRHLKTGMEYWETKFIVIAGIVIPFVEREIPYYMRDDSDIDDKRKFYFDLESMWNDYDQDKTDERRWYGGSKKSKAHFQEFFNFKEECRELCIKLKTPIVLIEPMKPYFNKKKYGDGVNYYRGIKTNVNLKEYGISKVYDSPHVYQMIDRFISNDLAEDNSPHGVQTDLQKAQSHGFDLKYGFRTRPKKENR